MKKYRYMYFSIMTDALIPTMSYYKFYCGLFSLFLKTMKFSYFLINYLIVAGNKKNSRMFI